MSQGAVMGSEASILRRWVGDCGICFEKYGVWAQ